MTSSFIQQLLDAISSPVVLLGILVGFVVIDLAQTSRPLAWLLFSFCCFTATLGRMETEWVGQAPPLVFPLEQIRALGRPLTILLLASLLLISFLTRGAKSIEIPRPTIYLAAVQVLILLKTAMYGSAGFAAMAGTTFGAVVLMMAMGPARWLTEKDNFYFGVRSLAIVGVIFIVLNLYQAIHSVGPITFPHGRLIGTTSNAQLAALILALTIPGFLYLIECRTVWGVHKISWLVGLALVLLALVLTASRTGALMTVVSFLVFYRRRLGKLFVYALGLIIVASVALPFVFQSLGVESSSAHEMYVARGNTRAGSWSFMLETFLANPLFGAPPEGERLVYGENSWLATAAALGLVGFVPLFLFGYECVKMMLRLTAASRTQQTFALQIDTVVAGLAALLIGSLLEAFLLGSLTFPIFALLLHVSLGTYLVNTMPVPERPAAPTLQKRADSTKPVGPVKRAISIHSSGS